MEALPVRSEAPGHVGGGSLLHDEGTEDGATTASQDLSRTSPGSFQDLSRTYPGSWLLAAAGGGGKEGCFL